MKRRDFIQAAPLTLSLLPCLPVAEAQEDVFKAELRRRFESLPAFLKSGSVSLADAVRLLENPNPKIELGPVVSVAYYREV